MRRLQTITGLTNRTLKRYMKAGNLKATMDDSGIYRISIRDYANFMAWRERTNKRGVR
jgi:predicted site-specific integrase-resolvase